MAHEIGRHIEQIEPWLKCIVLIFHQKLNSSLWSVKLVVKIYIEKRGREVGQKENGRYVRLLKLQIYNDIYMQVLFD